MLMFSCFCPYTYVYRSRRDSPLFSSLHSAPANTSWWQSSLGHALQCERLVLNTNQSKQGECVCVCFYVCVKGGGGTRAHSLFQRNHIYKPPTITFSSLPHISVFISCPCSPFFLPILWFNCRDQQTYGQWAVARKCYIFVKTGPDAPTVQQLCQMRGNRGK